jgi:dGTP triphosphohydrolase
MTWFKSKKSKEVDNRLAILETQFKALKQEVRQEKEEIDDAHLDLEASMRKLERCLDELVEVATEPADSPPTVAAVNREALAEEWVESYVKAITQDKISDEMLLKFTHQAMKSFLEKLD